MGIKRSRHSISNLEKEWRYAVIKFDTFINRDNLHAMAVERKTSIEELLFKLNRGTNMEDPTSNPWKYEYLMQSTLKTVKKGILDSVNALLKRENLKIEVWLLISVSLLAFSIFFNPFHSPMHDNSTTESTAETLIKALSQ